MPRQQKSDHSQPYREFEKTGLWDALNEGIGHLVKNQDLKETAPREYIVGYLCKVLTRRSKTLFSK
ncbi:MAG: hypothetical protein ACRD4V_14275 [Candidatus Acidiferrales bacterium]